MDLSYKEVYAMNREEARRQGVTTYMARGNLCETARLWHTLRHSIRHILHRHRFTDDRRPRKRRLSGEVLCALNRTAPSPPRLGCLDKMGNLCYI